MSLLYDYERAVVQILLSQGTVEDSKLQELLERIGPDFEGDPGRQHTLKQIFERVNEHLHKLSLDIRSVVKWRCTKCQTMKTIRVPVCQTFNCGSANSECLLYHGIANTEDDRIATDFGSEFDPTETKFFAELSVKLLDAESLSSDEISVIRPKNWTSSQTDVVLERLQTKGWLDRDEKSHWIIGTKTFLEMRSFLEESIRAAGAPVAADGDDGDDNNGVNNTEEIKKQIAKLPQQKLY